MDLYLSFEQCLSLNLGGARRARVYLDLQESSVSSFLTPAGVRSVCLLVD